MVEKTSSTLGSKAEMVYVVYIRKPIKSEWIEPFVLYTSQEAQAFSFLEKNSFPGEVFPVSLEWLSLKSENFGIPILEINDLGEDAIWEFQILDDEETYLDILNRVFKNSSDAH